MNEINISHLQKVLSDYQKNSARTMHLSELFEETISSLRHISAELITLARKLEGPKAVKNELDTTHAPSPYQQRLYDALVVVQKSKGIDKPELCRQLNIHNSMLYYFKVREVKPNSRMRKTVEDYLVANGYNLLDLVRGES